MLVDEKRDSLPLYLYCISIYLIIMKVQVTKFNDRSPIELEVDENSTPYDVLKKLELTPDTMIVLRDEKPIPIDEELNENDKIKIIQVISGG